MESSTSTEETVKELVLAKARIRELEQLVIQHECNAGQLVMQHTRETTVLQIQIAELNSAVTKYRHMLEEKSNG